MKDFLGELTGESDSNNLLKMFEEFNTSHSGKMEQYELCACIKVLASRKLEQFLADLALL